MATLPYPYQLGFVTQVFSVCSNVLAEWIAPNKVIISYILMTVYPFMWKQISRLNLGNGVPLKEP